MEAILPEKGWRNRQQWSPGTNSRHLAAAQGTTGPKDVREYVVFLYVFVSEGVHVCVCFP